MISRLEIKGFKSLVDVSIELGAVNVFVGANGSGKSNLLEAVGVISAVASGSAEAEAFRYRGVRSGDPSSYISSIGGQAREFLRISAGDDHVLYSVEMMASDHRPSQWAIKGESVFLDNEEMLRRKPELGSDRLEGKSLSSPEGLPELLESASLGGLIMGFNLIQKHVFPKLDISLDDPRFQPFVRKYRDFGLFFSKLAGFAIFSPSTPQLRGFLDDIHRDPIGLGGSGLGEAMEEMASAGPGMLGPFDLEDILELIDWAEDLGTDSASDRGSKDVPVRLRISDRFMSAPHKTVSALEASEGALYVLFLLALVGHTLSPRIFAVDNFDQALHPRLACALTRLISEQIVDDGSRQMLATTHNPLVLDGLDLLDDRIRLFTVDRDSTGASQVKRVLVTEELIEKGFSLSRLWTMGRLGGVPRAL